MSYWSPDDGLPDIFGNCDLNGVRPDGFRSFRRERVISVNGQQRKAPAIERPLPCSLEDLYKGTTKKLKISRDVVGASGRLSRVEEVLTVEIKPGWKKGTKITFSEKGHDTQKGVVPADIVLIIDEMPHGVFKRDGDDLIVTQNMSLSEALRGHTQVTTLDGRNLRVSIDYFSSLTHEEVVHGEGMPMQKKQSKKGNLIVKFNIKFPRLTTGQKSGIRQLLADS